MQASKRASDLPDDLSRNPISRDERQWHFGVYLRQSSAARSRAMQSLLLRVRDDGIFVEQR